MSFIGTIVEIFFFSQPSVHQADRIRRRLRNARRLAPLDMFQIVGVLVALERQDDRRVRKSFLLDIELGELVEERVDT